MEENWEMKTYFGILYVCNYDNKLSFQSFESFQKKANEILKMSSV